MKQALVEGGARNRRWIDDCGFAAFGEIDEFVERIFGEMMLAVHVEQSARPDVVAFKGFDLVINFNGVSGNKVYDNTANSNFYKARLAKSLNTTDAAVEFPNESNNNAARVSSRYLKSGAYFRLNNLSLGYNFNVRALHIDKWISSIRLSVTGQNLFVITDYDGYDPEVNVDRNIGSVNSYGIDYLSYPKAKSIIFGLNVSF